MTARFTNARFGKKGIRIMRKPLLAFVLFASVLAAPPAAAIPFFGDTAYLLRIIANLLRTIQQVQLEMQRGLQRRIDVLVSDVAFPSYPGQSIFDPVHQVLGDVRGIRRELRELSCSWLFSPRTSLLRDRLLRPLRLCRPDFQLLWGSSERHWDADLHEVQDFAGVLTDNLVSARVDAEESWTALFPRMEEASTLLRRSPGEANRDEAVLLAAAGQVAASNAAVLSQKLLVESLDWQMERHDEVLERYAGLGLLRSITCLDPGVCGGE